MDTQSQQTNSSEIPVARPLIRRPVFVAFFVAWVAVFAFVYFAMHAGTLLKNAGIEVPVLIRIQDRLVGLFSENVSGASNGVQPEPHK